MSNARTGLVTFKGNPVSLLGPDVKVGDRAPHFTAVKQDLSKYDSAADSGKTRLIVAVPSLDTSVCSLETRKFSERVAELPEGAAVYVISLDLPFAQKRFCGAENVENMVTLSDYQERSFGESFGVLIQELKLLARSVWVIGKDDTIRYREIVSEVGSEPNYDAAIDAARAA